MNEAQDSEFNKEPPVLEMVADAPVVEKLTFFAKRGSSAAATDGVEVYLD